MHHDRAKRGAYVLTVKENQRKLLDAIYAALRRDPSPSVACEKGKRGNRHEKRTLTLTSAHGINWPGVAQVGLLDRDVCEDGETRCETVAIVTSLSASEADANTVLGAVRAHWQIENSLHWVRDVTMGEDVCQVRKGSAPHVMAALRNTALGLIRHHRGRRVASAMRHFAAHVDRAFAVLGISEGTK